MHRTTHADGGTDDSDAERGASEVIGFILAFTIILGSVAILSVTAFDAMEEYHDHEQLQNAERAMDALAENFNDLARYDGLEEREGELAMRAGKVTIGSNGTELNVSVDGTPIVDRYDEFDHLGDDTVDIGEFHYEYDGTWIAYDGGAVVRATETPDGDTSFVLEQPLLSASDNTAIVSLVAIDGQEGNIRSDGSVGFEMTVENRTVVTDDVVDDVTIELDSSPHAERAWETYLDEQGWADGQDVDRVVITIVEADVDF
ncbi:DUF7289 family protein [Halopiger goleimassiliensis]|uniref:DUF7289 family protein n=1 Tax=Halopiger goleimassiliensis TaxID=1293048 RepID=UPI0006780E95|nr:hypothetical protein [Halopiger goleimassiliensis]